MNRVNRNYKVIIRFKDTVLEISPPLSIVFKAEKDITSKGLNTLSLQIFNLNETNRRKLTIDEEANPQNIKIVLLAGYGDELKSIFEGTIKTCESFKNGVDYTTEFDCIDGGVDYLKSNTSATVTNKDDALNAIIKTMPNVKKGKITKQNTLLRPKVMIGNSAGILADLINKDELFFINNEVLYIIKDDEIISKYIPVVNSDTGLLNTPSKKEGAVIFETMMNPAISIGGAIELESVVATTLNGIYRVEKISYAGASDGSDWIMQCQCAVLPNNYKVIL